MTRLHDAFDVLVDRGEPVGSDVVLARARAAVARGDVAELQHAVFAPRARLRIVAVASVCVVLAVVAALLLSTRGGPAQTAQTGRALLTQPSEAGLRSAATTYADAFLNGSYRDLVLVLDPSCASTGARLLGSDAVVGNTMLQQYRDTLKSLAGSRAADLKVQTVSVRDYTGRSGEAKAQYALPPAIVGNDNWNRYAYSGGRWHIAGCNLKLPIGGQSTSATAAATDLVPSASSPLCAPDASPTLQAFDHATNSAVTLDRATMCAQIAALPPPQDSGLTGVFDIVNGKVTVTYYRAKLTVTNGSEVAEIGDTPVPQSELPSSLRDK